MAGSHTSTNSIKNTHRPSFGSKGALWGLGSHLAVEDLPLGRLGRDRSQNHHLHRLQGHGRCARPAAPVPRVWPHISSSTSALWQHLKRALRRPRPSSWRLSISTFSDLSDPPGCMRMRGRGEKRERSPGCLSPLAHTARRVDESAKMACGVALSRACHFLMFGRCYLYVW